MTNKEFAVKDKVFQECCTLAKLEPTKRQASKYRNGKGMALLFKRQAGYAQEGRST